MQPCAVGTTTGEASEMPYDMYTGGGGAQPAEGEWAVALRKHVKTGRCAVAGAKTHEPRPHPLAVICYVEVTLVPDPALLHLPVPHTVLCSYTVTAVQQSCVQSCNGPFEQWKVRCAQWSVRRNPAPCASSHSQVKSQVEPRLSGSAVRSSQVSCHVRASQVRSTQVRYVQSVHRGGI